MRIRCAPLTIPPPLGKFLSWKINPGKFTPNKATPGHSNAKNLSRHFSVKNFPRYHLSVTAMWPCLFSKRTILHNWACKQSSQSICYYITSEFSLEWLKYKTAKPLLYTVYRTKPKTVRKEIIGNREVLRRFRKTVSVGAEATRPIFIVN